MHPLFITLARHAVLVLATALAGGCASYSGSNLVPGQSSQADARASLGEPAAIHKAAAGLAYTESWEYPRGPAGRHTYMARFDASGKLVRMDQVLNLATVSKIRIGADTRADVRSQLGKAGFTAIDSKGGESWEFLGISDEGRPRYVIYSVTFDARGIATAAGEREDPIEQSPAGDGQN